MSQVVGRQINYVDAPEDAAKKGMLAAGMDPVIVDGMMQLNKVFRAGRANYISTDLEILTGKKPTSAKQWMEQNAGPFRKQPTILVTGATGTIGTEVVKNLVGKNVRYVVN